MSDEPQGTEWVRYWFYRAMGASDTQARWRLRQKTSKNPSARASRYRHCDQCQQLLLIDERQCHRCHTYQVAPSWLIKLSRLSALEAESVIPIIAGFCLLGYLVQMSLGCSLWGGLSSVKDPRHILILGAALPLPLVDHFTQMNGWRLFSYTCLHGNLMHLGFNLIALIQIGPLVARTFGFARTLFIWVASGALAILLPAFVAPMSQSLVIGASGSVFGLIGVAMAYGHRVGTAQGIFIRNKMIEWTVFCTLFGLMMGGVAHSAHFGGLIGGAALSWLTPPPHTDRSRSLSPLLILISLGFIAWSLWSSYQVYVELT